MWQIKSLRYVQFRKTEIQRDVNKDEERLRRFITI